jgi:hypothetical protein
MTNPNPYRIPDEQRGHRPALPGGPHKIYGILVPEETHGELHRIKTERVRRLLIEFAVNPGGKYDVRRNDH